MLVEGEASRAGVTKRFAWAFSTSTRYTDCKAEVDGREVVGVNVTGGGEDRAEITIHGDHLFYDDLEATTAAVRFDALAQADADGDGVVTLDELARARSPRSIRRSASTARAARPTSRTSVPS